MWVAMMGGVEAKCRSRPLRIEDMVGNKQPLCTHTRTHAAQPASLYCMPYPNDKLPHAYPSTCQATTPKEENCCLCGAALPFMLFSRLLVSAP